MKTMFRLIVCASLAAGAWSGLQAADHRDAPNLNIENGGDKSLDINDVYVFRAANPQNTVLAMTVNPLTAPGDPTPAFNAGGKYEFKIDTNNNADEDITITIQFSAPRNGAQTVLGFYTPKGKIPRLFAIGRTGQTIKFLGGGQLRCDLFDDPFFFDLQAFRDTLGGVPNGRRFNDGNEVDFFEGFNASIIVLEFPTAFLGGKNVGVWARTTNAAGQQIDRMGIPVINTVFIPSSRKQLFNESFPAGDRQKFLIDAVETLMTTFGRTLDDALDIGLFVLPDMLPFNTASAGGFTNGRRPADDVIDPLLGIVTDGGITTDSIDANDRPFRNNFPYFALPQ